MKRVALTGRNLINAPLLNKGTAFTDHERDQFELHGLLPTHVGTLDQQMNRRYTALRTRANPFDQYTFLRELQDSNETLFYALLERHLEEILPIVYTPTVGEGCQRFSEIWRKPRGVFLSYPNRDRIRQILGHHRYDDVKCIVVSDGERILGLGDQGAGGMGIPIGKMALYTALGGVPPEQCLPILLDVGTDNEALLADPQYIGWRQRRVRGDAYDVFVDRFVDAVRERWPFVLLQWEDFAGVNAARLLERHRDRLCTFNDDIQGTAAVAVATLLSALNVTCLPVTEQRVVFVGFGSAGIGIADLLVKVMVEAGLSADAARAQIYPIDRFGLVTAGNARPEQLAYAKSDAVGLEEVVRRVKPTALIGVSGQPGAFTEAAVREMAAHCERPVIFPLSNPTSRAEATPRDLAAWTDGRALVGTGSPFDAVHGRRVDQTNNSYIFPGLALGIIASRARRVTDTMIMAAARELAERAPTRNDRAANLLPPLGAARGIARAIATAVGRRALQEGVAQVADEAALEREIAASVWEPVYVPYERVTL